MAKEVVFTDVEKAMIAGALELAAKSHDRSAKAAPSHGIREQYEVLAQTHRSLAARVQGSLL